MVNIHFSKQKVENSSVIHAHAINGIFRIDKDNIHFQATSFKCFQVAVAFCFGGFFRLKYAFTAKKNGITCHLLEQRLENRDGAYKIPSDLYFNTALIIGIVPAEQSSVMNVQMNGNDIDGKVTWILDNMLSENIHISDALKVLSTQSNIDIDDDESNHDNVPDESIEPRSSSHSEADDSAIDSENNSIDDLDVKIGVELLEWLISESVKFSHS